MKRTLPAWRASRAARIPPSSNSQSGSSSQLISWNCQRSRWSVRRRRRLSSRLRSEPCVVALAVLGHEEDPLSPPVHGEGPAHELLGAPVVVVPRVVEEGDALIQGGVHEADRFQVVLDGPDVPASDPDNRDPLAGAAQEARGNARGGGGALAGEDVLSELGEIHGSGGGCSGPHSLSSRSSGDSERWERNGPWLPADFGGATKRRAGPEES